MCLANELRGSLADRDFSVLIVLRFPWEASPICLAKQGRKEKFELISG